MGGSHWTCFIVKDNKSSYYDSFVGQPDKILLNQLPKPTTYHIYKIPDINSQLRGHCLYFSIQLRGWIIMMLFYKCNFINLKNADKCFW